MTNQSKTRNFILLAGLVFTVTAVMPGQGNNASVLTGQIQPDKKKDAQEGQMPVAIYAASEPTDSVSLNQRRARGSRYDEGKQKHFHVAEHTDAIEELPLNAHFWWGMPALPAAQSDVVLLGTVTSANAYLSNDHTGIYSEFSFRVEEVFKNRDQGPLQSGDSVSVEREGGGVRFQSGRTQYYSIHKQGMPSAHERYVFFLKHDEDGQDFLILTGYRLNDGSTFPLDSVDPFTIYEGIPEGAFLKALRHTISSSSSALPKEGGRNR